MSKGSKIKFTYFDGRGRGEVSRLILAAAGQPFEDVRIAFEDWPALKPKVRGNVLPVLQYNGEEYGQSQSVARFLAQEFGMMGKNNSEAAWINEAVDCMYEIRAKYFTAAFAKEEAAKAEAVEALQKEFKTMMTRIADIQKQKGKSGFIVGAKVSFADICLRDTWEMCAGLCEKGLMDDKAFAGLRSANENVDKIPTVKAYLAKRKVTPF